MAGVLTEQLEGLNISIEKDKLTGESLSAELKFWEDAQKKFPEAVFDQEIDLGFTSLFLWQKKKMTKRVPVK